jgi:hypothetical protein
VDGQLSQPTAGTGANGIAAITITVPAGIAGEFVLAVSVGNYGTAARSRLIRFRARVLNVNSLSIITQPVGSDSTHPTARVGKFLATQPVVRVLNAAGAGVPNVVVNRYVTVIDEPVKA